MRVLLLIVWILIPLPVVAYHFGPGQKQAQLDQVGALLRDADKAAADQRWGDAIALYEEALGELPDGLKSQGHRIRLERDKAQMYVSKLPEAHADLKSLVDELREDANVDAELFRDARESLANAQYYMTWLMRLEGRPIEDWEPEIQSARQLYQHLAEESLESKNDLHAERNQADLEASIRLARMSLADLQGLPLPSQ